MCIKRGITHTSYTCKYTGIGVWPRMHVCIYVYGEMYVLSGIVYIAMNYITINKTKRDQNKQRHLLMESIYCEC